jgi:hypothetical protein
MLLKSQHLLSPSTLKTLVALTQLPRSWGQQRSESLNWEIPPRGGDAALTCKQGPRAQLSYLENHLNHWSIKTSWKSVSPSPQIRVRLGWNAGGDNHVPWPPTRVRDWLWLPLSKFHANTHLKIARKNIKSLVLNPCLISVSYTFKVWCYL